MELVKWESIKNQVQKTGSSLLPIIEPYLENNTPLLKLGIPYAFKILDGGKFFLPGSFGKEFELPSASLLQEAKALLGYSYKRMPFGLVLKGRLEAYLSENLDDRYIPLSVLKPGAQIGGLSLFERNNILYGDSVRNLISGTRSLFVLPKLNSQIGQERLFKAFGIKAQSMKFYRDQWKVFVELIKQSSEASKWKSEVLFFPREVAANTDFQFSLLKDMYYRTLFRMDVQYYEFLWSEFLEKQALSIKGTFNEQMAKQILATVIGNQQGFTPVHDDSNAPIGFLTSILQDVYKIRFNIPTFMAPCSFNFDDVVYFSIQQNSISLNHTQGKPDIRDALGAIKSISKLVHGFQEFCMTDKYAGLSESGLKERLKKVEFKFFHPSAVGDGEVINTEHVPDLDRRFLYGLTAKRSFAAHALFLHGCVGIYPSCAGRYSKSDCL